MGFFAGFEGIGAADGGGGGGGGAAIPSPSTTSIADIAEVLSLEDPSELGFGGGGGGGADIDDAAAETEEVEDDEEEDDDDEDKLGRGADSVLNSFRRIVASIISLSLSRPTPRIRSHKATILSLCLSDSDDDEGLPSVAAG